MAGMGSGFDQHINDIIAQHAGLAQEPRLIGGARLIGQFEDAVAASKERG
jgi:hypothetical protein